MKKSNWLRKKSSQMTLIAGALILHCTAALVACSNPGSPSSGVVGAYVAGAPGAACFQNANYSGNAWAPYSQLGAQPYGDGVPTSASGLCACPSGSIPACGPNVGMMCVPNTVISGWSYQPALYTWSGGQEFRFNAYVPYGSETWNSHFGGGGRIVERPRGGVTQPRGRRRRISENVESSKFDALGSIDNTAALAEYGGSCTTQVAQTCIVGETPCGYGRCHSVTDVEAAGQAGICGR
jgi:hypothetical protein